MWLYVGWVSAYDAYFNLIYPVATSSELNPLAWYLLKWFGLPGLIGLKFAGTIVALGVLSALEHSKSNRVGRLVLMALVIIQTAVLSFLVANSPN